MPKASRKELRKTLFKEGAGARETARKEAKEKRKAIEAAAPPPKAPAAKRYILFVGNMPYDVTEEQIKQHFKSAEPSSIRIRQKGICFLEFSGENAAAQMHQALQLHHSTMKNRRINVEFSAGGGGNSAHRKDKIKQKNSNFQEELKNRRPAESASKSSASKANSEANSETAPADAAPADAAPVNGVHPARLAALKKK